MSEPNITIQSSSHTYPIYIKPSIRFHVKSYLQKQLSDEPSSILIITDNHVESLYLDDVLQSFSNDNNVFTYVISSGEQSKSLQQYENLLTFALQKQLDRKSLIIALGGGVVGDIAGFVASSYMRGIPFVQIPTTLLAHDSSVGGKVGINHPLGKNMIGAFHAPTLVLYDPECLRTLPETEWRSGFAEVIKHGFISDPKLLQWLLNNVHSFDSLTMEQMTNMLIDSISVKAKIVEEDEREKGVRAFLNFGHTLGHAIEGELGYGEMTHGEAVLIGMMFALELSEEYFKVSLPIKPFKNYVKQLGYETSVPNVLHPSGLIQRMKRDKKSTYSSIRFVLLKDVGSPSLEEVDETMLYTLLSRKENDH
ncbi:3-dehydroquinate synthase [Bacillus shivajii]|uniref:3-dehydroquinate synthase n=1 Tax=Bacillus shivajii TaxID=1983719 RepID=UPI001CFAE6D9|nr:3-dehydroquinate synthase [Bacillus shivajii]UCZ54780.1 3-dehydroquinate synthase [Bacillus shivajii]